MMMLRVFGMFWLYDHPPPPPPGLEQQKLPIESDCEADGNKNSNINHRQGYDRLR